MSVSLVVTDLPTSSRSVSLSPVVMTRHRAIQSLLELVHWQINWLTGDVAIAGDVAEVGVLVVRVHLLFQRLES